MNANGQAFSGHHTEHVDTPTLLYIEDDASTTTLFNAILQADINRKIHFVSARDVKSALLAVEREGSYAAMARPDVIVLDLNLPGLSGFAVLEEIRAAKEFAGTPVVIFSSSIAPADRRQAEILGATEFIAKPVELDDFKHAVQHICSLLVPAVA